MPGTKFERIIFTVSNDCSQPVSGMVNRSKSPSLPERFSNDSRESKTGKGQYLEPGTRY